MSKFSRIIVLTEEESKLRITRLVSSADIDIIQQSRSYFLSSTTKHLDTDLIAIPFDYDEINKKAIAEVLRQLASDHAVFIFQAERTLLEPAIALHNNVRGVLYRDEQPDRIINAVRALLSGEFYFSRSLISAFVDKLLTEKQPSLQFQAEQLTDNVLTKQEKRIIQLVSKGARNKEIALALEISANTVKAHLATIFRKTQSRNRVELLCWIQQQH